MAAGRGSRLGPHTDDRPKSLIDLGGISPLELQLDLLADRGVEHVVIVTGYRRDLVETAARQRAADRLTIEAVWNPFWSVTNVIGSAWMAREHLTRSFVYLHADTIFEPSILDDLLAAPGPAALPIDFRPCEPEQMKARVEDDRVVHLSKELPAEHTAGEFIGIGVFHEAALGPVRAGLDAVLDDGGLGAYFEGALNHAIDGGLVVHPVATLGRAWTEIDFEEDLELARTLLPRLRTSPG
jgi:choline kinase